MNKNDEKMVLFATSLAMQLADGLTVDEMENLRGMINQISCSLTTLINAKRIKKF